MNNLYMQRTCFGTYIYDSGVNEVLAVSRELFDCLQGETKSKSHENGEASEELNDYVRCGYLEGRVVEKIEHPAAAGIENKLSRRINMMTLQLTQRCNLRCSYCIYSTTQTHNRNHGTKDMAFNTAKDAVDFYYNHSVDAKEIVIAFYGGEPLLKFDLIKQVVDYAEHKFMGRKVSFRMTTNGVLLNDEIIDYLSSKKHDFYVMVSLDGPRTIQDSARLFPDGRGTYDKVLSNLRRFAERSGRFSEIITINSVIDTRNDYQEYASFARKAPLDQLPIQFNYVELDGRLGRYDEKYLQQFNYDMFCGYLEFFRKDEPKYANRLVEYHFNYMKDILRRFSARGLMQVDAPGGPCEPGVSRLFVDCDGRLFPCERVNECSSCMVIGNIYEGFYLDKAKKMLNIAQISERECKNCWAFQLCSSCVKNADCEQGLSKIMRLKSCTDSISLAKDQINQIILRYEHEKHERMMAKIEKSFSSETTAKSVVCIVPFTKNEVALANHFISKGIPIILVAPTGVFNQSNGFSDYLNRGDDRLIEISNDLESSIVRSTEIVIADSVGSLRDYAKNAYDKAKEMNKIVHCARQPGGVDDGFVIRIGDADKRQTTSPEYKLLRTPVVMVCSSAPECESFATSSLIADEAKRRGLNVSVITQNPYGLICGHTVVALDETYNPVQAVIDLNSLAAKIESSDHPDLFVVDIPEPYMMFNENVHYDFGLSATLYSRAIRCDLMVLCLPANTASPYVLPNILEKCRIVYEANSMSACITNCQLEAANDSGAQSLLQVHLLASETVELVEQLRAGGIPVFAPLLSTDERGHLVDSIINQLIDLESGVIS